MCQNLLIGLFLLDKCCHFKLSLLLLLKLSQSSMNANRDEGEKGAKESDPKSSHNYSLDLPQKFFFCFITTAWVL